MQGNKKCRHWLRPLQSSREKYYQCYCESKVVTLYYFYHLFIMSDMSLTKSEELFILFCSNYPLSIVLVGVGDGPWDMMHEFDDNIPSRTFDNFQVKELNWVTYATFLSRFSLCGCLFDAVCKFYWNHVEAHPCIQERDRFCSGCTNGDTITIQSYNGPPTSRVLSLLTSINFHKWHVSERMLKYWQFLHSYILTFLQLPKRNSSEVSPPASSWEHFRKSLSKAYPIKQ